MKVTTQLPIPKRISAIPEGHGWTPRPEVVVNVDYVRSLLERQRLTERDEVLLFYLDELGVLSTRQIQRLIFPQTSAATLRRRLDQLYHLHMLDRARMLDETEGVLYCLGRAGKMWLGRNLKGDSRLLVDVNVLTHALALSEIFVLLVEELRRLDPDNQLEMTLDWCNAAKARLVKDERIFIEPDTFFQVCSKSRPIASFYIELELDVESDKYTIEDMAKRYHGIIGSKIWQKMFEEFPTILIVTSSTEQTANLAAQLAKLEEYQTPPNVDSTFQPKTITWALAPLPSLRDKGVVLRSNWFVVENGQVWPARRIELNLGL